MTCHRKAPDGAKPCSVAYYVSAVRQAQATAHEAMQRLNGTIDRLEARTRDL